jgi:hypothetical protein
MTIDVFLSVGRTTTEAQEEFVREVERLLIEHDLRPHNLGRSDYSAAQPIRAIEELMDRCSGSVIIAFERLFVERGFDRRGSPDQRELVSQGITTVWNQIEAAMAYVKRQPLLVIVEEGVLQQGLLSHGHDWHVQQIALNPSALRSRETIGRLEEWKQRVNANATRPPVVAVSSIEPDKMTLSQLMGALRPAQVYGVGATVAGLLVGAFLLGLQIR